MKPVHLAALVSVSLCVAACETLSRTPAEHHAHMCESTFEGERRGHERWIERVESLSLDELERAADRLAPPSERRFGGAIGLSSRDEYYAAFELARRLEAGNGVAADPGRALRFYQLAADHTYPVPVSMGAAGRITQAPCPSPLGNLARERITTLSAGNAGVTS